MVQRLVGFTPLWVGATFDNGAFSVRCGTMCGMESPWWVIYALQWLSWLGGL